MAARGNKNGSRFIEETGVRYGKLIVLGRYNKGSKNEHVKWLCQCDCGNVEPVCGTYLRNGMRNMCNKCAAAAREEAREKEEAVKKPAPKSEDVIKHDLRYLEAKNTIVRLRKLRDKLQIDEKYIVMMRIPHAEEYSVKCTLIAKYPRYALFRSKHGICTCLGYHAIMTEEIVFTDDLVPRRVTA